MNPLHLLRERLGRKQAESVEHLRERLARFRDLVEKNNQVLELIADAGEKLGGEYVYDRRYLETLARDLDLAARVVVDDLNIVTDNRYSELVEKLNEIEAALTAVLEGRIFAPDSAPIMNLADVGLEHVDVVGEKMARLGEIARRSCCRVPPGFAITVAVFRQLMARHGRFEIDLSDLGDEELAELARQVREWSLAPGLARAVRREASRLASRGKCEWLAVRSSAVGEDGAASFAGQFKTLLGVSPRDVPRAYCEVVASLFEPAAAGYWRGRVGDRGPGPMAVGCLCLVKARASGVLYTVDPSRPEEPLMLVSATWGLGTTVVEGLGAVDRFVISRSPPHAVVSRTIEEKGERCAVVNGSGHRRFTVTPDDRRRAAISDAALAELAAVGLRVERFMRGAQDIEWVIDEDGQLFVVQTRPLRLEPVRRERARDLRATVAEQTVLLRGRGEIACRGIAAGEVRIVRERGDIENLPPEAVLVARTSSPRLAAAMGGSAAVITDVGTSTGHLAAVARELRLPAIVDVGNATEVLQNGQVVTVDAEENVVYQGRVERLLHYQLLQSSTFEESLEFRMLRKMLRRIAPLHLRDPRSPDFVPQKCSTYHDIIRFAHEKAVDQLVSGQWVRAGGETGPISRLRLPIPLDLVVVDLGGGLERHGEGSPGVEEVRGPLRPVLEALVAEGVWATGPADMDLDGLMASATRASPVSAVGAHPEQNLAIISSQYLHLALRLGYHFNIVDCFLSEVRNDNYLYFRFVGGVTEMVRRTRRALLLKKILEHHDFVVEGSGDLVIGRNKKASPESMREKLMAVGRLIGFSRQLDVMLREDELVDRCVDRFLAGCTNPWGHEDTGDGSDGRDYER